MEMKRLSCLFLLMAAPAVSAEKMTAPQLIEMARANAPGLKAALADGLGEANIKNGTAALGRGENFIWAVEATSRPMLQINGTPGPAMTQINGTNIWWAAGKLKVGTSHMFEYMINGK